MSGLNGGNYEPKSGVALKKNLSGMNHMPVLGGDSDMNNGQGVEGGFRDYTPTKALVRKAISDYCRTFGIKTETGN